jgi:putative membrane protein
MESSTPLASTPTAASEAVTPMAPARTLKDYFGLFLRGFAMGSADVVPGVSGGTIAFISGIYEELIDSIRMVGQPEFLRSVFSFNIQRVFELLNWKFLLAVLVGIGTAVLTLAKGIEWLLHNQPILLWSFFFGLVVASVVTVSSKIKQWNPLLIGAVVVGSIGAYILVGLVPIETPNDWWFLFFSGALAICAMILPGISGAFILVLLGKYQYALSAITNLDLWTIFWIGSGCAIGLVSFSQVLGMLFKKYHDITVALLIGLMIGSLRKVWPWKETVEFITDRHGEIIPTVERNLLPAVNGDLFAAMGVAIVGFIVVLGIERVAQGTR